MKLTQDNYFSKEANMEYLSVSQYKDFVGTYGIRGCEAMARAKLIGEWEQEMTLPLLVGSYVDASFEGTLDIFKGKHPEIFTQKGELKSQYKQAEEIIQRIERDEYMMKYLSGEKQVIMTGEIFGVKWKIKIDSLDRDVHITDLKVMKSLTDTHWVKDSGYMSFVEYWGYDIQGAIYQEIVRQNIGKTLPFFIAGASKEKYTDIEIIGFLQANMVDVLSLVEPNIRRIIQLKNGEVTADRCETCDWCKWTKVLDSPIHYSLLNKKI